MDKIIRGRLKSFGKVSEFLSVQGRIVSMIRNNKDDNFDFVMEIDGKKSIKSFGIDNVNADLVGKEIPIVNDSILAKFNEDGTVEITYPAKEEKAKPKASSKNESFKIIKKFNNFNL